MSRVGKAPVAVPQGVTCTVDGMHVKVKGPKGELERTFEGKGEVSIRMEDSEVVVERANEKPETRAMHGLTRALINNMVNGVTTGFERKLELVGVGYRCALQGKNLQLQVGYSHPVVMEPPAGITFAVEGNNQITVSGADKQQVGQVAANVRAKRKPEPYKGKGIRYQGEYVRSKEGKSGGKK